MAMASNFKIAYLVSIIITICRSQVINNVKEISLDLNADKSVDDKDNNITASDMSNVVKNNTVSRKQPPIQVIFHPLYPRGLRVYVTDFNFTLVRVFASVNEKLTTLEKGNMDLCWVNVPKTEGYWKPWGWLSTDLSYPLQPGDTIFYWIRAYREPPLTPITTRLNAVHNVSQFWYKNNDKYNGSLTYYPDIDLRVCPNMNCDKSITEIEGRLPVCKGELIFREDFDATAEDLRTAVGKKWIPEIKFIEGPDYLFNFYSMDDTVYLQNGSLIIKPVFLDEYYKEAMTIGELRLTKNCTGRLDSTECERSSAGADILPPIMTAKLTTKKFFNFKYGRVVIRAKLPTGNWLLPEITLEPRDHIYGDGRYASGLIRIAFVRGNPEFSKTVHGGPVLHSKEPIRSWFLKEKVGTESWSRDFHDYSVVWGPDAISMLVDGEEYGTIGPEFYQVADSVDRSHAVRWLKGSRMAPLDEIFHISLGLRVGGLNDFDDIDSKPYKNYEHKAMLKFWEAKDSWLPSWIDNGSMQIDSVKVYAL